jgi:hypothetical protein
MTAMKAILFAAVLSGLAHAGDEAVDITAGGADAIMRKMAANMDTAAEIRRQYVYQQVIKGNIIRGDGQLSRKETREYTVTPQAAGTDKKLVALKGEYRKGKEKQTLSYTEPGFKYKDNDIDGELLSDLIDDLTDDKDSRDGISESLFPLRTKDLASYKFAMKGRTIYKGRSTYEITFEPLPSKDVCIHIGDGGHDCEDRPWKGEAWIDAEDLQPVRIDTELGRKIPWVVRGLLGTNLKQLGFSVSYTRVADGIWFPNTYGTEFRVDLLWFYKRTISLSLVSSGFQKTDANSKITYDLPRQGP